MSDRLQVSADKLTEGLDRLNEADELLKKMDAQLKDVEGKSADSLRKTTKAMQDSVKNIRESISGKRSERQGYGQLPQMTVMNSYFNARGAIDAKSEFRATLLLDDEDRDDDKYADRCRGKRSIEQDCSTQS